MIQPSFCLYTHNVLISWAASKVSVFQNLLYLTSPYCGELIWALLQAKTAQGLCQPSVPLNLCKQDGEDAPPTPSARLRASLYVKGLMLKVPEERREGSVLTSTLPGDSIERWTKGQSPNSDSE